MHGEHFLLGQVVIEDGEDRFLDLAGIGGAADEHQLFAEVDHDEGFGIGAVQLRHGVEARGRDDGEIRPDVHGVAGAHRGQEHVAGEQVLPGGGGDDPNIHLVIPVRPGVAVLDKEFFALQVGQQPVMELVEFFRGEGLVLPAPMDIVGAGGFLHNEFILGGPAGIGAGAHHHRPQVGDQPFLMGDDLFIQGRGGQIPMDRGDVSNAVMRQVFLHSCLPQVNRSKI